MEDMRNHLVVAALEFGTTYSSFAFSMQYEFEKDPLKMHCTCINNTGAGTFSSLKQATCLLLDKEKKFVAFGYDAEHRYADLVMNKEQYDYYFFDRFTMILHNNENVTRDMILKDKTDKQCSAVEVFTLSITVFVDPLMKELEKINVVHGEVLWVLTVPATWTDNARQLMKESAENAGLHAENVLLITEAQAAFTYFQYAPTTQLQGSKPGIMIKDPGTKSMVVDLGDMAADITVIQQTYNGKHKELFKVTEDDCGGTSVDDKFFKILEEIAGEKVMSEFKENAPISYIDLVREIEAVNRGVRKENKQQVNLTIPLVQIDNKCKEFGGKSLQSAIDSSSYVDEITLFGDKLRFSADLIIKLFTPTIDGIITLMKNVVSNRSTNGVSNNVSNIVMIGRLSKCPMIQDAVYKAFPGNQIIIHDFTCCSVLQGAVLFGHRPDYHRSEISYEEGIGK